MSAGGSQFKSREDQRRSRELEEARKAGTIPAERDAEGNEINPHIPQYMSTAPWYLNQDGPGLGHQRNLKEKRAVATARDFIPKGQKAGPAASIFRKGACANCGAMTHSAKDCVERPRKKGAKYSGKEIKADELVVEMAMDYAGKRDHWAQYDGSQHMELIKQHEATTELRLASEKAAKLALEQQKVAARQQEREERRARKRKMKAKTREALKAQGADDEGSEDSDSDSDSDSEGEDSGADEAKVKEDEQVNIGAGVAMNKNQGSAKMTARNLRIREDTAKYLLNLDVSSAYYDPKTRSMRENPLPGTNPVEEMYSGDNFMRATGDSRKLADLQLYQFEAFEKGQNLHLNADPTTVEKMNQIFREKKLALKDKRSNKIIDKYGGTEHLSAPPAELLFAQTEEYVEYNRSGGVLKGQEKAIARSKYKEDELTHNHTAVWGSFFDKDTFRWGYADDHSTVRNSYSTGQAGKLARAAAAAALEAAAPERAAPPTLSASSSNALIEQRGLFGIEGGQAEPLDEAKVRAAMEEQKRAARGGGDERGGKRKYNSMTSDAVDAEAMEAYYRNKSRADDPMAK